MRAQYVETFVVVRCTYRGETYSRCVYIWVDKDFAMVRGHHQGYPKKLGELYLTRPVNVGVAGPRLEPGGRFGATCSAYGRRLIDATFTITGTAPTRRVRQRPPDDPPPRVPGDRERRHRLARTSW